MRGARQISIYGLGQALAYGIDFGAFWAMAHLFGDQTPVAFNIASKSLSALFGFLFHHRFSFPDAERRIRLAPVLSFGFLLAVNMVLTSSLLWAQTRYSALPLLADKFLADLVGVVVTYVLMRTLVFPRSDPP